MSWLGLDIGGANLKAANAGGWARSTPLALWRNPNCLTGMLAELIADAPKFERLAVTMTGELCDCFCSKAEGVASILASVREIVPERKIAVYRCDGQFVSVSNAVRMPTLVAASNWRAVAELALRYVAGRNALLVDIGSTTTDIIPIADGRVAARGRTDIERLLARELVYCGVGRTPVCALTSSLSLRGRMCPVAKEFFSTTADAYLLLGDICEDSSATWTADGRPLVLEFAKGRLARQLCADAAELTNSEIIAMAEAIRAAQLSELRDAVSYVAMGAPEDIVCSGSGEFLVKRVIQTLYPACRVVSLAEACGPAVSQSAAAFALAVLASEGVAIAAI